MSLYDWGWSDDWTQRIGDCPLLEKNFLARVTAVHRGQLRAVSDQGDLNVYLSGKYQQLEWEDALFPATGDWIVVSPPFSDVQEGLGTTLLEVLPRRTKISRVGAGTKTQEQVIAANVDTAFIVTSVNHDFSVNRVQRYLLIAESGGVKPVLVLSKSDLLSEEERKERLEEVNARLSSVTTILMSSLTGEGVESIRSILLPGHTSVFVGSSGVGKSTLVNCLLGTGIQNVKAVREGDDKGRHTTTTRELFRIPGGGMIIDTPGLREVQVMGSQTDLDSTFDTVAEFLRQCRFTNCTHSNEPECAVQKAISEGDISRDEWESYQKLQRELEFVKRKLDKQTASNQKKRWKQIHKDMRQRRKFEGR